MKRRILKENPDAIVFKDVSGSWARHGFSTFMIYPDLVLGRGVFVSVNYNHDQFVDLWADNGQVYDELMFIYTNQNSEFYMENPMVAGFAERFKVLDNNQTEESDILVYLKNKHSEIFSSGLRKFTHVGVINFISLVMNRTSAEYRDSDGMELSGRVFNIKGVNLVTFWQERNEIKPYKKHIANYLSEIGIDYKTALYQTYDMIDDAIDSGDGEQEDWQDDWDSGGGDSGWGSSKFLTFEEVFGTASRQMGTVEKLKKDLANQLHIKKGQLDKAILDVLAEKPASYNDLYAGLEKQLGMPIAKIKHVFRGIPLDKLVVKEVREHFKRR